MYHVCTHTHIHIHTHTHTKCAYEHTQSTSETMAPQGLRGKPSLTPRSSALLPVCCNLEGDTLRGQHPNHLSTRNNRYAQNNHNQQQLITPSQQRAVQTTFAYLHWCGANPPSSLSTQAPSLAVAPQNEVIFCHFGGVFL